MFSLLWRFLLFLSALWFIQRTLGFFLGAPKKQPRREGTAADATDANNKMVRDPICGMYLDPRLAISHRHKKETVYFCSKECLQKFTANST